MAHQCCKYLWHSFMHHSYLCGTYVLNVTLSAYDPCYTYVLVGTYCSYATYDAYRTCGAYNWCILIDLGWSSK